MSIVKGWTKQERVEVSQLASTVAVAGGFKTCRAEYEAWMTALCPAAMHGVRAGSTNRLRTMLFDGRGARLTAIINDEITRNRVQEIAMKVIDLSAVTGRGGDRNWNAASRSFETGPHFLIATLPHAFKRSTFTGIKPDTM